MYFIKKYIYKNNIFHFPIIINKKIKYSKPFKSILAFSLILHQIIAKINQKYPYSLITPSLIYIHTYL